MTTEKPDMRLGIFTVLSCTLRFFTSYGPSLPVLGWDCEISNPARLSVSVFP